MKQSGDSFSALPYPCSPSSLVTRLKMMNQRVCSFGWAPMGPVKELIESRGLDGWLEGPSFGSGIKIEELANLVMRMQTMRKMMGGGMGMGGMPMNGMGEQSGLL